MSGVEREGEERCIQQRLHHMYIIQFEVNNLNVDNCVHYNTVCRIPTTFERK